VATVITMYLLPEVNLQLRPKLLALAPGTRIVSHDWDLGDWHPDRSIVVEAPDELMGLHKHSLLRLWIVPARLAGQWCAGEHALQLQQTFQMLSGHWLHGASRWPINSRIEGAVAPLSGRDGAAQLVLQGDQLRVEAATGAWSALRGAWFARASPAGCQ
jgi:hypothetical protein